MDTNLVALLPRTPRRARRITAGKLTGQKPALKTKEVWAIRARLELWRKVRIWRCSISRSTASFEVAIWSPSGSRTSRPEAR